MEGDDYNNNNDNHNGEPNANAHVNVIINGRNDDGDELYQNNNPRLTKTGTTKRSRSKKRSRWTTDAKKSVTAGSATAGSIINSWNCNVITKRLDILDSKRYN